MAKTIALSRYTEFNDGHTTDSQIVTIATLYGTMGQKVNQISTILIRNILICKSKSIDPTTEISILLESRNRHQFIEVIR